MNKIALLPVLLLAFGALATSASADDSANSDPEGADPGISALRGALAAFREARAADQACRGAQATDQCKSARAEARATLETVRADAVVAHHQYAERLQAWRDAKTPEERAAIAADLKGQADEAKKVIDAHRDETAAMRGKLEDRLARLDPKLRDQLRKDAVAIENEMREKNTTELSARIRDVAAKFAQSQHGPTSGNAGEQGTARNDGQSGSYRNEQVGSTGGPSNDHGNGNVRPASPSPKLTSPTESHSPRPSSSPETRATRPSSSPTR